MLTFFPPASWRIINVLTRLSRLIHLCPHISQSPQHCQRNLYLQRRSQFQTRIWGPRKDTIHRIMMMRKGQGNSINSFQMFWSFVTTQYRKKAFNIDPHEEFLAAACCIACCIDIFCKTKQLINVGLALQLHNAVENGELFEDEDAQVCCEKQLSKM
jgi:hypothetical protein